MTSYLTRVLLLLLSASLLALACADGSMGQLRRHTYPPEFNYISQEQLQSTMWQLAALIQRLDSLMDEYEESATIPRGEVADLLGQLERTSRELGPGGWGSNHPRLGQHLDRLRYDLKRAKLAVERDPPNYFWAGSVSGACMYCHGPRG